MDYFDLSVKSKVRLSKWIDKRYRKLCISELIRNSKDERQLFAMCRYIDRWYDQHEGPVKKVTLIVSQEDTGASQEDTEVIPDAAPETAPKASYEVPTHLKQHFSKHVTHRLNVFITNNPEVGISKMIANAATEDDLMAAMDEIESKKTVVDPRIKRWTVRRLS